MYGASPVCARDEYSGMIVEFTAMPIKNTNNNTKRKTLTITQKLLTIHDQIYFYIFLPSCSLLSDRYFLSSFSMF